MDPLQQYLFIDIETVPCVADYSLLSEGMQHQWQRKARLIRPTGPETPDPELLFNDRAGIYSEFAKVVCISIGCLVEKETGWKILLKSIVGDDEKTLLKNFCTALTRFTDRVQTLFFCGHNIKEFDIPFLCRRLIIQGMSLPDCMQLSGRKPWDIPHVDTMELWRFGDYKNFTSLGLLAEVLGIPTPKDDIDGSMVAEVYWKDRDLKRIANYCVKDVLTTARVFLRLRNLHHIQPEAVILGETVAAAG